MKKNSSLVKPHPATRGDLSALFADTALKNPATEPSVATIVQFAWDKAQDGLRSIVEFGALLLEVEAWLKKRTGTLKTAGGTYGLKAWLAEHAPEVDYKTAMGYKYAASGLMALADKAQNRPLLVLMGEQPLSDKEEEEAREQVLSLVSTSSLRLLKAAAKAERSELGRPKGGTSAGRRAKEPLALSEEWMQRAEAASGELGGVCMVAQAELLLANPGRLRTVRSQVADCLRVLDGLCKRAEEAE
jgi:hypothetical protein